MKVDKKTARLALEKLLEVLPDIEFTEEKLKDALIPIIKDMGLKNGQVLWPMRVALTGAEYSPGAFEVATILGKERSLERIQAYLDKLT